MIANGLGRVRGAVINGPCDRRNVTIGKIPQTVSESRVAKAEWWVKNGVPLSMLRALVRSGDLERTRRGVYATKKAVEEAAEGARAKHAFLVKSAIAFVGDDAVACSSSAALIHGLEMLKEPPEGLVTLLRPDAMRRNRRRTGNIVFRAGALVPDDDVERRHVIESYGVRVTTALRTVADLARELPFIEGVVVADSALRKYSFRKENYLRVLYACRGWRGTEKAREVIRFADPNAESVFESGFRVRLHEWGFGVPETQVVIPLGSTYARVDFLYPKQRAIIEVDGKGKMREDPDYSYKDRRRDQRLRDVGYKIAHVHWAELFGEPEVVIARVRKVLAAPSSF